MRKETLRRSPFMLGGNWTYHREVSANTYKYILALSTEGPLGNRQYTPRSARILAPKILTKRNPHSLGKMADSKGGAGHVHDEVGTSWGRK